MTMTISTWEFTGLMVVLAALCFRQWGRLIPKSLFTTWIVLGATLLLVAELWLSDYFASQGMDVGIVLPLLEEFDWLFVVLAYSDRWLSLAVLLSLIAAIALRTILPRADDVEGLGFRGSFRFVLGDVAGALHDYDQLLAVDPDDGYTYYDRAQARCRSGHYAGAVADFERAVQLNPKSADLQDYINWGNAYAEMGNLEQAIATYTAAITYKPTSAMAHYNRGNVYVQQGNYAAALADYDQAIALYPNYAEAYHNRAVVRTALGNTAGAAVDRQQVLRLKPGLISNPLSDPPNNPPSDPRNQGNA